MRAKMCSLTDDGRMRLDFRQINAYVEECGALLGWYASLFVDPQLASLSFGLIFTRISTYSIE